VVNRFDLAVGGGSGDGDAGGGHGLGLIDVLGDVQIRNLSDAWLHAGGNVLAVVIELYNWYSRYDHGSAAVVPTGLVLSLIVVLVLLFTGWKGWEMVYRHRVGVSD
jgi:uncharacterized membrane protein